MIILLYGQDSYQSTQKLNQLRDKFIKEVDPSRLNIDIIDSPKISLQECQKMIKSVPFLAKRRLIIFKNIISAGSKELLDGIYKILEGYRLTYDKENSNAIVFFESTDKLGRTKLAKLLKDSQYAHNFEPLQGFALNKWIRNEVRNRDGKIEEEAIKELASLVGNDLWVLDTEINKLIGYAYGQKITKNDVALLVKGKFDDNIFNLVDALGVKNKKLSLKLISDQLSVGAHPMYLLSMLVRQYRILLGVKEMVQHGKTKKDISLFLGVHPFVVQKAMQQSQNYSMNQLFTIYRELLNVDIQLKSGSIKEQGPVLFELLVSRL